MKDGVFQIRVEVEQRERWRREATKRVESLAEWIAKACDDRVIRDAGSDMAAGCKATIDAEILRVLEPMMAGGGR